MEFQKTPDKEDNNGVVVLRSPPSGAESLFLGGVIVNELQGTTRSGIKPSTSFHSAYTKASSVSIDDFVSCVENASDLDSIDDDICYTAAFVSPTTVRSSRLFSMEPIDDTNNIMAKKIKSTKKTSPVVATEEPVAKPPLPDVPVATEAAPAASSTPMKVDPAEIVYGKAKDILAWGKSVPVVSFFVGTSEAVAGTALGVVGTDLSTVDSAVEKELTKLDGSVLNPAIEAIAKILMGVAGKSEETLRPLIEAILKPLGKLLKSKANEASPEAYTETPEVTN